MAQSISASQLIDDLTSVIRDAESLLRATAAQTGDRVEEIRARAEETVRQAKARLAGVEEQALDVGHGRSGATRPEQAPRRPASVTMWRWKTNDDSTSGFPKASR